ncbi:hypothetical protein [Nocardia bhagyanarayanae]|uniref:Uncharacterized protein n=1 Tax=Nocardia bhagyanarayanae TaxID=1215925 RepID=A0A543F4F1_9NOCA|nr:hypothetical protein [Nocardia bhagyanarayanae]TQM28660.1 hypothetical protein FB390_0234 [Nocardia bhagyanarayanae]
MARDQFENDATDPAPRNQGTPVARVVPITPASTYVGGGSLLGHVVLGYGWNRAETD